MTPGLGGGITFSPAVASEGWNTAIQAGYGIGMQAGVVEGGDFVEVGAMTPGASITSFYYKPICNYRALMTLFD